MTERLEQHRGIASGRLAHGIERRPLERWVEREPDPQLARVVVHLLGVGRGGRRGPGRVAELVPREDVEDSGGLRDSAREHSVDCQKRLARIGSHRHPAASRF